MTQPSHIPVLDGWRGLAILLVLISHGVLSQTQTLRIVGLGVHGVAVFFVLSGFLITRQLLLEERRSGSISLRSFYIRRFFRIIPCTWAYLAAIVILTGGSIVIHAPRELIASLLFFRNYVDPHGINLITSHFWSLSIEEQFYIAWPAVLIVFGRKRAVWFAGLGALGIAFLRWHHSAQLYSLPAMSTYQTQYRADGLLLGCCAALLFALLQKFLERWTILPLSAFLLCSFAGNHWLTPLYESVTIALLMAATVNESRSWLSIALSWKPLRYVGKLSYSLYLWQQIFLVAVHTKRGLALSFTLLPVIALLSYRLIEQPCIDLGKRLIERRGEFPIIQTSEAV